MFGLEKMGRFQSSLDRFEFLLEMLVFLNTIHCILKWLFNISALFDMTWRKIRRSERTYYLKHIPP